MNGTVHHVRKRASGSYSSDFRGNLGIGLEAARQSKSAGAKVLVVGFDRAGAERIAAENGFEGWRAADVTRPDTIVEALADMPPVDHLVLLAGTFVAAKVMDADVAYLRRAFDERLWAAVHTLRALGDRLASDGSVTFISGALADRPNAMGTAVLAAASAAMEAFARGVTLELAPRRVNTVSPGTTDTPLLARTLGPQPRRLRGIADRKAASPPSRHGCRSRRGRRLPHEQWPHERRNPARGWRLPAGLSSLSSILGGAVHADPSA